MNNKRFSILFALAFVCLCGLPSFAHAQGAGIEWDKLNQEVIRLYRVGKYDRAVVVAQQALQVAERNVSPNHPNVATSLENLAGLYRATQRNTEAETLERRAARICVIKR